MRKPTELQYSYKKLLGFTQQQKRAFDILEQHDVNVNQFIRAAVAEKIKKEWKQIKESKTKTPF